MERRRVFSSNSVSCFSSAFELSVQVAGAAPEVLVLGDEGRELAVLPDRTDPESREGGADGDRKEDECGDTPEKPGGDAELTEPRPRMRDEDDRVLCPSAWFLSGVHPCESQTACRRPSLRRGSP